MPAFLGVEGERVGGGLVFEEVEMGGEAAVGGRGGHGMGRRIVFVAVGEEAEKEAGGVEEPGHSFGVGGVEVPGEGGHEGAFVDEVEGGEGFVEEVGEEEPGGGVAGDGAGTLEGGGGEVESGDLPAGVFEGADLPTGATAGDEDAAGGVIFGEVLGEAGGDVAEVPGGLVFAIAGVPEFGGV